MYQQLTAITLISLFLHFSNWGFYAHKQINRAAVFTLPNPLFKFYKLHLHELTEKAVDADKRRYVDPLEGGRHYIDLDAYPQGAIDSIPIHWSQAKEKMAEQSLRAKGILPWQIHLTYQKLIRAFADQNVKAIIRHSADLGHYIADAHVPLHSTQNYNGQFTNQIGIHAFWETRLPEAFAPSYNLFVGKARLEAHPQQKAWDIVLHSASLVDSVLGIERELAENTAADQRIAYVVRHNRIERNYSDSYTEAYHKKLNNMVERQMRASIQRVGSYWYTAWVNAGKPKLTFQATEEQQDSISYISPAKIKGPAEWPE